MAGGTLSAAHLTALTTVLAGRYRLERELGAGGMATVWLAEDLRHSRQVAIKVLHPELSAVLGPDRFLAEIKTTANLQHPHILPLFDSGAADGLLYYVMPFVDGETLRARLERERQLPIADAVRLATELADALAHAHARGIVHRDIKPENILLQGGHALVADFGIALAVQHAGGARMTQTGLSLGTPQYMAPEQAMGEKTVDARADIYALGAVTYEMLAGEPPFTGPTVQAIVARVMTETPAPLGARRHTVPPHVEDAVLTALEKLPADRFATVAELASALRAEPTAARVVPRRGARQGIGALLAVLALTGLTAAGAYIVGRRTTAPGTAALALPSRLALLAPMVSGTGVASTYRQIAITPRGDAVVFVALSDENVNTLAYHRLDASRPTLIEGTRGVLNPQISPDGRLVVAWSVGTTSVTQERAVAIPVGGGTPRMMPIGVYTRHAVWAPDGTFWFTPLDRGGVAHLTKDGKVVPVPGGALGGLGLQHIFGDGRTAIGVRIPVGTASGPAVLLDLETGKVRPLIDIDVVEVRVAAGNLLYVRPDGTMWAAPFDERAGEARVTGDAVQIASEVSLTGTGLAQWAVAPNGTVAYIPEEPRSLVLTARDGSTRNALDLKRNFHAPKFSPDGNRLAVDFTSADGRDVWILSLGQRTLTRATFTRDGHDAVWTPDGRAIDFASVNGTILGIHRVRPGSAAPAESIFASPKLGWTGMLTPDTSMRVTVGTDVAPGSATDLVVVDRGGRGEIRPLIVNQFETQFPALSADGRWLAYVSNQSGSREVYVRPLARDGEEVQVSQEGGTEPVWRRDGRELFYLGTTRAGTRLVAASVRAGAGFEVLGRRPLFDASEVVGTNPHANYDVSPDGSTFAMIRRSPATRIMILQNLPALVQQLRGSTASAH